MTILYWVAAAAALASATGTAGELARHRLPVLTGWALSMAALGASLTLAAVSPDVLQGGSGAASRACAGFGVLGTRAFAEVLASGRGDTRRVADMMTAPLLGSGCMLLLLLGLHWAGSRGTGDAGGSGNTAVGIQLTLVAYYVPGLGGCGT
jgi:hypothetical protein